MLCADVGTRHETGGPDIVGLLPDARPDVPVAAQLALLRDVADEIVVAARHVGRRPSSPIRWTTSPTSSSTTRTLDPVDRPVGWVHSLCTRDWILWVDDDEIPVRSCSSRPCAQRSPTPP